MSHIPKGARTQATAPTVTDDSSKGYAPGSEIVVTGVTPRVTYKCTNAAVGAAVWIVLGLALFAPNGIENPQDMISYVESGTVSLTSPTGVETPTWSA